MKANVGIVFKLLGYLPRVLELKFYLFGLKLSHKEHPPELFCKKRCS